MLRKIVVTIILGSLLISCNSTEKIDADLLVFNAEIYTVNDDFSLDEDFVVKDG